MPPVTTSISFSLEATPGGAFDLRRPNNFGSSYPDFSKGEEFCRQLYKELGITPDPYMWVELDMDSPKMPRVVERLGEVLAEGNLEPRDLSTISIGLEEKPGLEYEWYALYGRTDPRHRAKGDSYHPKAGSCKADQAPPGAHLCGPTCVSERFKKVVQEHSFRGAEFFWLQDKGRYRAPQWYEFTPLHFMGRGIDFEWFDNRTLDGDTNQSTEPEFRRGVTCFTNAQLQPGAGFKDQLKSRLMSLFPPGKLRIATYSQLLRPFLPNADFGWWWDRACIHRRVREALLAQRMIQEREMFPLLIWDEAPAWAEVLDKQEERAKRVLSEAEVHEIKAKEVLVLAIHTANPKPVREVTLEMSLKMLKAMKKMRPESFRKKAKDPQLEEVCARLPHGIPAAWQAVLRFSDGFESTTDFTILSCMELPDEQKSLQQLLAANVHELPKKLLAISRDLGGDFHCLNLSSVTAGGECPVMEISHETLEPEKEWPSIAAFLEDLFRQE